MKERGGKCGMFRSRIDVAREQDRVRKEMRIDTKLRYENMEKGGMKIGLGTVLQVHWKKICYMLSASASVPNTLGV